MKKIGIELNRLGVEGRQAFGLGAFISWKKFKGISILLGKFVISVGFRTR